MDKQKALRVFGLFIADIFTIVLSVYGALILRFNGPIETMYLQRANSIIIPIVVVCYGILYVFEMYKGIWKYASIAELWNIIFSSITSTLAIIIISYVTGNTLPATCYLMTLVILVAGLCASRYSYRLIRMFRREYLHSEEKVKERVLIYGAGSAGEKILREITSSSGLHKEVVCFIDDDDNKWTRKIHNVKIKGGRDVLKSVCKEEKIDEIIVAMPSTDRKQLAEVLNICKETKCRLKRVPGYYQILNGSVHLSDLKDVEVQDLLGRDQIEVNLSEIMGYVKDKVVMVTGGGGSIGSELCRQIAASNPKQLIIVDIYENNAYDIQLELKDKYPHLNLETLIASVRNTDKVNRLFEQYHPDIVYHAAAHKHVPLMEDSPCEAVKNNVFGTLNVVRAADKYGTKRFILISTDKAVNPTNVMGATKRMCEMIVQSYNKKSNTEYVAVRFGNVLGSNGSVIPLFKKQIKAGGPVTVTHPDIIRYFMTIPEAVSLVLQAGTYAKGGEIFVLDMGEPVKIDDMARNLIKLSGYEPDIDIKIEYTGLRPGEKLFEELLMKEEGMQDTPNKLIHIGKPIELDEEKFFNQLVHLKEVAYQDCTDIRKDIKEIVDTYQPQNL
ncbi:MAG: polysaccharide biosynthesis protein [Faecalibacillus faecis]|uniref:polysaccharide biosynthesis protein n=1 Tax=Faecalibacillus faecis TaxID=1982628 RepID=UPI0039943855